MKLFISMILLTLINTVIADDLESAPKPFLLDDGKAVFIDIISSEITINFGTDINSRVTKMSFYQPVAGFPIFDCVRIKNLSTLIVNGVSVSPSLCPEISDPHKVTKFRIIKQDLTAGYHTVEFHFTYNRVSALANSGVKFEFIMQSEFRRNFLENYFPANLEYDKYSTTIKLNIKNSNVNHRVIANGEVRQENYNKFTILFPAYYTASSYYMYIFPEGTMFVREEIYQGINKPIPLVVFSEYESRIEDGLPEIKKWMPELESNFGAFPHDKLIVHMSYDKETSEDPVHVAEYCGALRTSSRHMYIAMPHLWFGRGVMPSGGNTAWLGRSISKWISEGYPRAENLPYRSERNFANHSSYSRGIPGEVKYYSLGLMRELDYIFRDQGGLKPHLASFFQRYKNQTVTTKQFQQHLQLQTNFGLEEYFSRYIYGIPGPMPLELDKDDR